MIGFGLDLGHNDRKDPWDQRLDPILFGTEFATSAPLRIYSVEAMILHYATSRTPLPFRGGAAEGGVVENA